jgi:hypothetical protein
VSQILVLLSGFVFLATEDTSAGESLGIQIFLFILMFILGSITFLALVCPPIMERFLKLQSDKIMIVHMKTQRNLETANQTSPMEIQTSVR